MLQIRNDRNQRMPGKDMESKTVTVTEPVKSLEVSLSLVAQQGEIVISALVIQSGSGRTNT